MKLTNKAKLKIANYSDTEAGNLLRVMVEGGVDDVTAFANLKASASTIYTALMQLEKAWDGGDLFIRGTKGQLTKLGLEAGRHIAKVQDSQDDPTKAPKVTGGVAVKQTVAAAPKEVKVEKEKVESVVSETNKTNAPHNVDPQPITSLKLFFIILSALALFALLFLPIF